ncbi:sulfatase family protein [Edaphobacter aggregans]|uniref:sulfatase family protein n=1 Tax=Edaphobacter aggregans TaxID=570835 RepID=UPI000ABC7E39|nr:sulfatase [Edaphobacter aggregans]
MSEQNKTNHVTDPSSAYTTRRDFLQGSLAAAGSSLLSTSNLSAFAEQDTHRNRPNLVFFFGEGQRADALSIAGNPILKTPHHDRIGREGIRFENAFCTNALCAPARASVLTGLYSRTNGALSNEHINTPLPEDLPLFTELLHQAGYEVAILGKIHVRNGVEERYWDYYFGHNSPGNDYVNPYFKEGRKGKIGEEKRYQNVYPDDLTVDRALQWLEEDRGDKPFCLLIWFVAPHEPFFRARRHFDLYRNTVVPKPATFDDDLRGYPGKPKGFAEAENKIGTTTSHIAAASHEGLVKDYYAGLVAVDENIGRVTSYLEKKGIFDDTAIVQSSDHGFFLGEFRLFDKRLMHEPSIRVPLMIRYPTRIPAGTVRKEQVLDIDLAPTFLDLAGVPIPEHFQGKSVLPLAKRPDPEFRKEWYYEYYEWPNPEAVRPHRGIRTERYKLIHYVSEPQAFELYDLHTDPGETVNLYGKPEVASLQQNLLDRLNQLQSNVPQKKQPVSAKTEVKSLTGEWRIAGSVQGFPVNVKLSLVQNGNQISGTSSAGQKKYPLIGAVDGKKVVLAHDSEYQEQTFTMLWSGTLGEDGNITGNANSQPLGMTGTFTARRSEPHGS